MDQAPEEVSYSKIRDNRNAKVAEQERLNKQDLVAQRGLNDYTANPELSRYFANQQAKAQPQGLGPVQNTDVNASDYTRFATEVANKVGSQEEYTKAMFGGVTTGAVDPGGFFDDEHIPEGAKQTLMSLLQGGPQNEQPPIGLNPR